MQSMTHSLSEFKSFLHFSRREKKTPIFFYNINLLTFIKYKIFYNPNLLLCSLSFTLLRVTQLTKNKKRLTTKAPKNGLNNCRTSYQAELQELKCNRTGHNRKLYKKKVSMYVAWFSLWPGCCLVDNNCIVVFGEVFIRFSFLFLYLYSLLFSIFHFFFVFCTHYHHYCNYHYQLQYNYYYGFTINIIITIMCYMTVIAVMMTMIVSGCSSYNLFYLA